MRITAATAFREIGNRGELPVLENAVRDAQAAHEGILRRRDVKQPVIAPAEIVRRRRRHVVARLLLEARVGVERMLLALELLGIGQLLAVADNLVLGLQRGGVRTDRFGIGCGGRRSRPGGKPDAAADAPDLEARHEAFEVTLLLVAEIG